MRFIPSPSGGLSFWQDTKNRSVAKTGIKEAGFKYSVFRIINLELL